MPPPPGDWTINGPKNPRTRVQDCTQAWICTFAHRGCTGNKFPPVKSLAGTRRRKFWAWDKFSTCGAAPAKMCKGQKSSPTHSQVEEHVSNMAEISRTRAQICRNHSYIGRNRRAWSNASKTGRRRPRLGLDKLHSPRTGMRIDRHSASALEAMPQTAVQAVLADVGAYAPGRDAAQRRYQDTCAKSRQICRKRLRFVELAQITPKLVETAKSRSKYSQNGRNRRGTGRKSPRCVRSRQTLAEIAAELPELGRNWSRAPPQLANSFNFGRKSRIQQAGVKLSPINSGLRR